MQYQTGALVKITELTCLKGLLSDVCTDCTPTTVYVTTALDLDDILEPTSS